jgi:hypothetical protein
MTGNAGAPMRILLFARHPLTRRPGELARH